MVRLEKSAGGAEIGPSGQQWSVNARARLAVVKSLSWLKHDPCGTTPDRSTRTEAGQLGPNLPADFNISNLRHTLRKSVTGDREQVGTG